MQERLFAGFSSWHFKGVGVPFSLKIRRGAMIGRTVEKIADLLGKKVPCLKLALGFTVDSRKVLPGYVFFALKGEKVDGHDFLREVKAKGAVCAFVDKSYKGKIEDFELIPVDDVLSSLHKLANLKMRSMKTRCIGITGSVGKTTTKEFLATLLEGSFKVGKTPGNENSQVGVPLSILSLQEDPDVFVAEMGMSKKGEIASLVSVLPPEIAIVTQVSLAHTLYFPGGAEEVAEAKAEILSSIALKKAFVHGNVLSYNAFKRLREKTLSYGYEGEMFSPDAFVKSSEKGLVLETNRGSTREFTLPFTAKHLTENFLGAALAARELGLEFEEIFERASLLKPYSGRFEKIEKDGVVYINDSYNASPISMRAALENTPRPKPGGKVIAALGHMGELGLFSKKAHQEIGEVASLHADLLLCVGEDTPHMAKSFALSGKPALYFDSFEEFKNELKKTICQGDVVLVKASNSLKLWRVLEE